MAMETATLIINRIDWRYLKPNEVTSHGMAAPIKSSIKWMEVKCKNCQHEWKSYEGNQVGCFQDVDSEMDIDCPRCSTTHKIPRARLD
jgi:ribosomal protein S27E